MNLRQQLISDRVDSLSKTLSLRPDPTFLRLAHSIVTGQSIHAFDKADLVDGGQDKQVDTITIIQDDDEAVVYIVSAKNTESFSSNAIIQTRNGLDWVFNKSKADLTTLSNTKFRDRINDLRSVLSGLGYSNVSITVAFVTNGLTSELSDEFKQEQKHILDKYDNGTFARFTFEAWGADELVTRLNALEKRNQKIDAEISIRYDANNPSLIKYHAEGLKGLICSTSAKEIAKLVLKDVTGSIFDANIRRFLGTRGAVNSDILRTCADTALSHQFWFLNNGITVICDSFDPVTDPDNPHVKVKNMQIVNGCQTASALAIAEKDGKLASDARVLLRIYEAADSQLVDKIVLTTNNQNKISSRDLRANDKIQVDMQDGFSKYNFFYERKVNQYGPNVPIDRIVVNEIVAQSYLAIVLKKPSDARRRKYKVWGELYDRIFSGQVIEPYVLAMLIFRSTEIWLANSGLNEDPDDVKRKIANNGSFHVARIASFIWRPSDNWNIAVSELQERIALLEKKPNLLDDPLRSGFEMLEKLIKANPHYASDLDTTLKSAALETEIDKELHTEYSAILDAGPKA
jgi:hypothetical protein